MGLVAFTNVNALLSSVYFHTCTEFVDDANFEFDTIMISSSHTCYL